MFIIRFQFSKNFFHSLYPIILVFLITQNVSIERKNAKEWTSIILFSRLILRFFEFMVETVYNSNHSIIEEEYEFLSGGFIRNCKLN